MSATKITTNINPLPMLDLSNDIFLKAHHPHNPLTHRDDRDNHKYTHKYTDTHEKSLKDPSSAIFLGHCHHQKLSENIWFVWSYSGVLIFIVFSGLLPWMLVACSASPAFAQTISRCQVFSLMRKAISHRGPFSHTVKMVSDTHLMLFFFITLILASF